MSCVGAHGTVNTAPDCFLLRDVSGYQRVEQLLKFHFQGDVKPSFFSEYNAFS
jgi:hypothetical protein